MLLSLKTESRAAGPMRPLQEGGRWAAGTCPGCAGPAAPAGLRGSTGDGLGYEQGGKDWKAITAGPVSLKVAAHRDVGASRPKLGDWKQQPCLQWVGCSAQGLVLVNKTLELASRPIANARFRKFTTFFFFLIKTMRNFQLCVAEVALTRWRKILIIALKFPFILFNTSLQKACLLWQMKLH